MNYSLKTRQVMLLEFHNISQVIKSRAKTKTVFYDFPETVTYMTSRTTIGVPIRQWTAQTHNKMASVRWKWLVADGRCRRRRLVKSLHNLF